jgi:hypothetical protein
LVVAGKRFIMRKLLDAEFSSLYEKLRSCNSPIGDSQEYKYKHGCWTITVRISFRLDVATVILNNGINEVGFEISIEQFKLLENLRKEKWDEILGTFLYSTF